MHQHGEPGRDPDAEHHDFSELAAASQTRLDTISGGEEADLDADGEEIAYDWDIGSDTIRWGANFASAAGLPDVEMLATGLAYAEHLAPDSPTSRYEAIVASDQRDAGDGVSFKTIYGLLTEKRSTAAPVWIEDSGRWFAGADQRPTRARGVIRVITRRYEAARRSEASAQRDAGTGAFNRAHFIEHISRQLSLAARKTCTFAILVIGFDHDDAASATDEALAKVVASLRTEMRGHELLARHAGAKLVVLLEECNAEQADAAAQRFLANCEGLAAETGWQHPRIGAVIAPVHGRTPQALLQCAEEALEIARQPDQSAFVIYSPDLAVTIARQSVGVADQLAAALKEDRLELALQPVVQARSRSVVFYEGLVRVREGDQLLLPDLLICEAERSGLVPVVDSRVLDIAFAHLTRDRSLALSVNAAVSSLQDAAWLENLRACCRRRPDAARRLTVEITETQLIADIAAMSRILATIRGLGVRIAIDDFGSGHSSFRNLRELQIDYLKIDGVFAQNLAASQDDRFFIRTLIDLARNLGIPTVAEWVEDEATARILTDWGVDYLQGHLFGKAELPGA